jgi:hypothetical protein
MQTPTNAIAKTGASRSFIKALPSVVEPAKLRRLKITAEVDVKSKNLQMRNL